MKNSKLFKTARNAVLIQFLAIGAGLNLAYHYWFYQKPVEIIQISSAEMAEALDQWISITGKQPDASQRQGLIDQITNNEILYRQALERNFDLLPVVRRRLLNLADFLELVSKNADEETRYRAALDAGLVQRDGMIRQYMISAVREQYLSSLTPKDIPAQEITEYFQQNMQMYIKPAKAKISHVYFGGLDQASYQRATAVSETLRNQNISPQSAIEKGDPFYGSYHLPNQIERQIAAQLGTRVARKALELPLRTWSQPIESPYGHHLLWVAQRSEAAQPILEEVKTDVISRIRRQKRDTAFQKLMGDIRSDYQVNLPQEAS